MKESQPEEIANDSREIGEEIYFWYFSKQWRPENKKKFCSDVWDFFMEGAWWKSVLWIAQERMLLHGIQSLCTIPRYQYIAHPYFIRYFKVGYLIFVS